MRMTIKLMVALALAGAGCVADAGEPGLDEGNIPGFEDYVDGKMDTGYVGTRAAEIEATFAGRVRVMVPDKTAAELETIAGAIMSNPSSWEHREITSQVTEQIKYARNALKVEKLNANLEGGDPTFTQIDVIEGGLELSYTISVESLVKFKDLEMQGLRVEDLVGRQIQATVPLVPAGLFERVGARCATDAENPATPVDEHDLGAHNLFFYWDARREGCPLGEADLVTSTYRIESSIDAPTVYPEYDRLVADGRIDMVAIFGQIEHGELKDVDWGFRSFRDFSRVFERKGFRIVERLPENHGHRLEKTYPGGLVVSITILTPVQFADSVPREQSNEVFRAAMRSNEIVYYNGHAFYGSLTVLDEPSAYPADTYQIVFMDACWSYAYYTKQIFRNRATEGDPTGYALVDVVNNTEPGITGSEHTAAILWENVFKGAAAVRSNADATIYSWNNLIKYMNDHAEERARLRGGSNHPNPEIYGASGVRANEWQPGGGMEEPPPPPGARVFESTTAVDVPDDDAAGVSSTIAVPAGAGMAGEVRVRVEIDHSYVGDLEVTVEHGGRSSTLHQHSGGSADDLALDVRSTDFRGADAAGDWVLRVKDTAAADTGRIVRWSVEL